MGNVSSRPDEGVLFLRDQSRVSIASLTILNSKKRVLYNIVPNAFPTSRVNASREAGDDTVVDFVQDPESTNSNSSPSFLLRINNEDELDFRFSLIIRQGQTNPPSSNGATDTAIQGLTYAFAPTVRELDSLVTREFHADPNFHKNPNVQLVGDFTTGGSPSVQLDWSWKWRPPKPQEDKGGGWRSCCSFLEYDQRAHRLTPLATFSFWVQNIPKPPSSPHSSAFGLDVGKPPRIRVASAQSFESALSGPDSQQDASVEPPSPVDYTADMGANLAPTSTSNAVKVDLNCQRTGNDMSTQEDGPVFRATMKQLEQKTGNLRIKMKKVLRKAEAAQQSQEVCNGASVAFMDALREASVSNANAIQPALEHYFERIAREILQYEKQNTANLQKMIIDPLTKLYNYDIKQAESKKRDFEDESSNYYAYVGRYLGQRQDSLKEKKRAESDTKYQTKRRNFELKRFDYSSFMEDLHGGRKEQEVLSYLTKFADAQAKSYLAAAKKVEEMIPQLEALTYEVREADKEFQFRRTEREEKRRNLEKSTKTYVEPESTATATSLLPPQTPSNASAGYISDSDLAGVDSTTSTLYANSANGGSAALSPSAASTITTASNTLSSSPGAHSLSGIPSRGKGSDKFKGYRDLEDRNASGAADSDKSAGQQKKEGLLWALSRPGSHVDPKGLNKQAWHKFWIVLDQGKLSEYSNWKQRLDLHMDPIDLRMASVREARSAERRFCFEVITPQYKRVYQATSEDDMNSWILAINNALQSAFENQGRATPRRHPSTTDTSTSTSSRGQDIKSALTGKISSHFGHTQSTGHSSHAHSHAPGSSASSSSSAAAAAPSRRTTVGARPTYLRQNSTSYEDNPSKLLQLIREHDQGNKWCADCGSGAKVEWVSINLGIILCIECSGIHRSLGTHITKIRSLTLDTTSFSTDIVELILQIGNRVSNMIWEAKLEPPAVKLTPNTTREQRLKFITAKYVDRDFVSPLSSTASHYASADETLLASIKKNDLQGVLYGLALGASPNAADKSRATHAVFLALAAADPAKPASPSAGASGLTSSLSSKPLTSSSGGSGGGAAAGQGGKGAAGTTTAFPIAELLVQNGADIPSTLPAFPLSRSAQLYILQKSGRDLHGSSTASPSSLSATSAAAASSSRTGAASSLSSSSNATVTNSATGLKSPSRQSSGGTPSAMSPAGDTLAPLPSFGGGAGAQTQGFAGSGSGSGGSGQDGGSSHLPLAHALSLGSDRGKDKEKDREAKLQKRGSAAARLARTHVVGFAGGFVGGGSSSSGGGGGNSGGS